MSQFVLLTGALHESRFCPVSKFRSSFSMPVLPPNSRLENEKWLVYDNRAALQAANQRGMHAFITGIFSATLSALDR